MSCRLKLHVDDEELATLLQSALLCVDADIRSVSRNLMGLDELYWRKDIQRLPYDKNYCQSV